MTEFYKGQAEMETMFPGISEDRAIKLIRSVERLIPMGTRDRLWYLELLIKYVDGLINGDDIIQFTTSNNMTSMAKAAIEEVSSSVQEKILSSYREERSSLIRSVEDLSSSQKLLKESVDMLLSRKKELLSQTTSLGEEANRLNDKCESLRTQRMAEIEEELRLKRGSIDVEIARLEEEKASLSKSIEELKRLLDRYSLIVSETSKSKGRCEVTWEFFDKSHPIYNTNHVTIKDFVFSLISEYQDNMGVSYKEAQREFSKYAPTLDGVVTDLLKLKGETKVFSSINLLYNNMTSLSPRDRGIASNILESLKAMKLPKYKMFTSNIDEVCVSEKTLPNNVKGMMRELYFQRVALEAVSKQHILEAELKTVLGALQSFVPDDYDMSSLSSSFSSLESMLGDDHKLSL